MEAFWDAFLAQDSEQDGRTGLVIELLERYHRWLEDKGLVFDPSRGFTIEQLICFQAKSNRMAEVTNNPSWKRTYHRLSDAAAELMGRIHRTRM